MVTYFFRALGAFLGTVTGAAIILGIIGGVMSKCEKYKGPPVQ